MGWVGVRWILPPKRPPVYFLTFLKITSLPYSVLQELILAKPNPVPLLKLKRREFFLWQMGYVVKVWHLVLYADFFTYGSCQQQLRSSPAMDVFASEWSHSGTCKAANTKLGLSLTCSPSPILLLLGDIMKKANWASGSLHSSFQLPLPLFGLVSTHSLPWCSQGVCLD